MKDHQFEEIVFWLSLIACLLAYYSGIGWLVVIIAVISVKNCIIVIKKILYAKIKRCFCNHRWELATKNHEFSEKDNRWYEVGVYICKKCNKMKVVRPNKTKSSYVDR